MAVNGNQQDPSDAKDNLKCYTKVVTGVANEI